MRLCIKGDLFGPKKSDRLSQVIANSGGKREIKF
jgi:hypothetical protein